MKLTCKGSHCCIFRAGSRAALNEFLTNLAMLAGIRMHLNDQWRSRCKPRYDHRIRRQVNSDEALSLVWGLAIFGCTGFDLMLYGKFTYAESRRTTEWLMARLRVSCRATSHKQSSYMTSNVCWRRRAIFLALFSSIDSCLEVAWKSPQNKLRIAE